MRDGDALKCWLVEESCTNQAVEKESHDQHPGSEEPEKVLSSQQVQQQNQHPHVDTSQTGR
jgi:hypothetical protein